MIYLDYNSTAPCRFNTFPKVAALPLNPSPIHGCGRAARNILEEAREKIYSSLKVDRSQYSLVFTSSGTEANNLVVNSFKKVFASAVEHNSIFKVPHVSKVAVDKNGIVEFSHLRSILSESKGGLLCLMLANNETGVLQPVKDVAIEARNQGVFLHSDCVQAFGKLPLRLDELGADSISISAHKIGALPGIGALIYKSPLPIAPLIFGGGQEMGLRAGTENVFHADLFGQAAECICSLVKEYSLKVLQLRDYLESQILAYLPSVKIWSKEVSRLPNTSCILMPGVPAQIQIMKFDLMGFAVSAGSACSSGRLEESHVLKSMGVEPHESSCSVRVSLGPDNTAGEVQAFIEAWKKIHLELGCP